MAHQRAHWTPSLRDEWINYSVASPIGTECDNLDGYMFLHMVKPSSNMDEYERCDSYRSFATSCLSQAVYESYPIHKRIALGFYETLISRIDKNSFLALMFRKGNFLVLIKGNNAHKMLLKHALEIEDFEYTDLDIALYINPYLDEELFEQIKKSLVILTSQVMSRYKKDLDALMFRDGEDACTDECILDKSSAEEFKEYYTSLITSYEEEEEGYDMLSPFQGNKIRNLCSERSYMTLDSETDADYIVCVEVPHLPMCEFIPLAKSPLVLSYNNTSLYDRDTEGQYIAHFETFKLQLNNMLVPYTFSESTIEPEIVWEELSSQDNDTDTVYTLTYCKTPSPKIYDHDSRMIVPSNFLIVSIPCQDDAQLLDFWKRRGYNNNKCHEIYDDSIDFPILVPTINECIRELTNTLNVYTNRHTLDEEIHERIETLTTMSYKHLNK